VVLVLGCECQILVLKIYSTVKDEVVVIAEVIGLQEFRNNRIETSRLISAI